MAFPCLLLLVWYGRDVGNELPVSFLQHLFDHVKLGSRLWMKVFEWVSEGKDADDDDDVMMS